MRKKPNIVVFMTDQQLGDTILPGHPAKTPNVDRLRQAGLQFTQAFTASPHCCPSRATFFTGLYPTQHNIWNNVEVDNALSRDFYDGVTTFPEMLQKAGYHNMFSGKWHVSGLRGPLDCGFHEVIREQVSNYGRTGGSNQPLNVTWERAYSDPARIDTDASPKEFGRILRPGYPTYYQFGEDPNPFHDTDTVEMACERLRNYRQDEPFFLYVGTVGPHDPYNPPQEFIDLYDPANIRLPESFDDPMEEMPALYRRTREAFKLTEEEHKESIRRYLAFCSYEDHLFGKLLDTLEEQRLMDDTIVIYLTDHGDYLGAHGLWAKGLPCYREAYQLCAVVGGAGVGPRGQSCDELVALADFAPTILELAGLPAGDKMVGRSLVPFLNGEKVCDWRTEVYTQTNGNEIYGIQRAVWNKKWKLVYNSFDYDLLFDLENDPLELHNVIDRPENREVVRQLWKKLWTFARRTGDTAISPYIMVALAPYGPGITLEKPAKPV